MFKAYIKAIAQVHAEQSERRRQRKLLTDAIARVDSRRLEAVLLEKTEACAKLEEELNLLTTKLEAFDATDE